MITEAQWASAGISFCVCKAATSTTCPSSVCTGTSVENLTLDGLAQSVDGIINQYAQNNSYVDHVRIYQILGTGLNISTTGANNSGPYSNILFDTGV